MQRIILYCWRVDLVGDHISWEIFDFATNINNIFHSPEAYQTQSLNIYRQVKNAMQATEHATIQRDQAHARERALSEEVNVLHERLKSSAGKVRHHPSHTSAFVKRFKK